MKVRDESNVINNNNNNKTQDQHGVKEKKFK